MTTSPDEILRFWFEDIRPAQWWKADPDFDALVRERFGATHRAAAQGECWGWRVTPPGRLAEVIVLDQFSRNIHRGTPAAFASDPMALALAQEAVAGRHDQALPPEHRVFFYMPYEHSESLAVHAQAVALFEALGIDHFIDFERKHLAIVERFGRYPHRNAVLGRVSTEEELEFLKLPGSGF